MRTNIEFYHYSQEHPEEIFDPFYENKLIIIPPTKTEKNILTENNEKLIKLITAFSVLDEYKKDENDETVVSILDDIIRILDNTKWINYSAFTQYFMVVNSNFSQYKNEFKTIDQKREFIYEMLKRYCKERHEMYLSHGYSDAILQVMCDNYSHKRNSKKGINKVLDILQPYTLKKLTSAVEIESEDDYYFLPDKGGKKIFESMLLQLKIKMESRSIEQNKLPDIVFKHNNNYYICELKTMKEGGGGQNKQIVEIAYFIKFSELDERIHYITFLDSGYSNTIFKDSSPKIKEQRKDIIKALNNNPSNYFLNTKGLKAFAKEVFGDQ